MAEPTNHATDPLGPIDFILNVLGTLTITLLLTVTLTSLFGSGSGLGITDDQVCAEASPTVVQGPQQAELLREGTIGDNGTWGTTSVRFCAEDPSATQEVLHLGIPGPGLLFWIGLLVLTKRLTRRGRRDGMFTDHFAHGVGLVGAYLLVGCVVVAAIHAAAQGMLIATLLPDEGAWIGFVGWDFSFSSLIAGFGLLTVSRVLHQAVAMRDDLDATI